MVAQVIFNGIIVGLLYSLVAVGFAVVYGGLRILHIALGSYYTAAAYLYIVGLDIVLRLDLGSRLANRLLAIVFTLGLIVVLTVLTEIVVYRPLFKRAASPLVTLISSLGVYLVLVNIIGLFFGDETRLMSDLAISTPLRLGPLVVTYAQGLQAGFSALILGLAFLIIYATSLGRNIRALSDNPSLLGVFGYDIGRIRVLVLSFGSILAACASLLKAVDVGVNPHVGLTAVLSGAVAMMIGAFNSLWGTLAGALLLGIAQNLVTYYFSTQWSDAVTFLLLIVILSFRQNGLFAPHLRAEET